MCKGSKQYRKGLGCCVECSKLNVYSVIIHFIDIKQEQVLRLFASVRLLASRVAINARISLDPGLGHNWLEVRVKRLAEVIDIDKYHLPFVYH
jgi:hypothetical protein